MHNLAKQRLAAIPHTSVDFIIADFKQHHLAQPDGNMKNIELYMTKDEHMQSLSNANFRDIQIGLEIDGLCTLQATL